MHKWLSALATHVTMGLIFIGNPLLCRGADAQQYPADAIKCVADLYNSSEAAPLRPHMPLDPKTATLNQLSNPSYATARESAAIRALYPRYNACRQPIITSIYRTMPNLGPFLQRAYAAGEDDIVLLIQRKISWGETITRWRNRTLTIEAELQRQLGSVAAGIQQQNQAEMARQAEQQRSAALARRQNSQELLDLSRRFSEMGQPSRLPYGAYQLPNSGLHCTYGGGYMQCN